MNSMTILGARSVSFPPFPGFPGLPGTEAPARRALVWRVAVIGYGRHAGDPRTRIIEIEASDREELRAKVARGSREDAAAYRVGD